MKFHRQYRSRSGFTIVELLMVIVVIGILAAIAIIAFNGIQNRAKTALLQSDLTNAAKALENYRVTSSTDTYPEDNDCSENPAADTICLEGSDGTTFQYTYDDGTNTYALTATYDAAAYYVTSTNTAPTVGAWSGHEAPGEEDEPIAGWWVVDGGESHTCGIYNGVAYCWGANGTHGTLGINSTTASYAPVAVNTAGVLNGKALVDIAAQRSHTCVLDDEGKVYCWGYNASGQLGNNHVGDTGGGSFPYARVPVAVDTSGVLAGKTVTALSAGGDFMCAIADGKAYCWGNNGRSALGRSGASSAVPVAVNDAGVLAGKTLVKIASGYDHTCVIDTDGKLYCWGYNYFGMLGNNTSTTSVNPVEVVSTGVLSGKVVTDITGGESHTCAIADGAAFCWGWENDGQLGNNADTATHRRVPLAVNTSGVLSGKTLVEIASVGSAAVCALASTGELYCWGNGDTGKMGNGTTTMALVPTAVTMSGVLSGKNISSLRGAVATICAYGEGEAFCWGRGDNGQYGNGTNTASLVPIQVNTP